MKKINKIAILLLAGFGAATVSCSDSDDWAPGPQPANDNPGVYFDMNLSPQAVEIDPLNADQDYFILTLGRDKNKVGSALQVPITVVQADQRLIIPQAVTFEAGSPSAEFKIGVPLDKAEGILSYALEFDASYFNPYIAGGINSFSGEVIVPEPVTPENIATYIQGASVKSVEAFLNGGTARYNITLMSSKLEGWRSDYQQKFPAFSYYTILMPRSDYQISVTGNFTPSGLWYRGPQNASDQGIIAMSGTGNNPLSDVTFSLPRSSTSGAPSGYNAAGVNTGAISFFNFLQESTGFTIIRDRDSKMIFWFRSKADPNDWFKCERYQ